MKLTAPEQRRQDWETGRGGGGEGAAETGFRLRWIFSLLSPAGCLLTPPPSQPLIFSSLVGCVCRFVF